ncbi:MAG: hypothetical protein BAJALOKI1v1_1860004 [Promethearchaeota archaeon]|nr:MAG: hypothetical protein BAJALOKI1v1_1860004 [Candidatus Lokiarchaeota archaeon]
MGHGTIHQREFRKRNVSDVINLLNSSMHPSSPRIVVYKKQFR